MSPQAPETMRADPGDGFRRLTTRDELSRVTDTINLAFSADPTWAPLLVSDAWGLRQSRRYWEFFATTAQRYPWSFANDECTAASIWYPPGADELSAEEEEGFPAFASELFEQDIASQLLRTTELFDAARPEGEYFYLSLLAVHPSRRGEGLGMRLLAENLREIDALSAPSYLESSNPANDAKYERMGYRRHGRIELPSGLSITTFWRDPA